ncbi:hypothetical protein [uncultured Tateyamaria sp.]|uniref:hypothetical protein n=1 Tax=uncultured Tateyamaria sp. TaxID=455651 RepID=UPI0026205EB1|nr:hypothetical protein [uncultured Tateyamaria sp.]
MSRLNRTTELKTARTADIAREPATPDNKALTKSNAADQGTVSQIRATVTFPATSDFTVVLANYIRDIETNLPPGGQAPKPAVIFRSFLDKYDAELGEMLKTHLAEWNR